LHHARLNRTCARFPLITLLGHKKQRGLCIMKYLLEYSPKQKLFHVDLLDNNRGNKSLFGWLRVGVGGLEKTYNFMEYMENKYGDDIPGILTVKKEFSKYH